MLKPVFQLIGLIVVLLILLLAVLFYLDGKDLLSGELADFIGSARCSSRSSPSSPRLSTNPASPTTRPTCWTKGRTSCAARPPTQT